MYLDLVVVLVIIIFGLIKYKRFSSYVYLFCFTDILFRVLNFLNVNVKLGSVNEVISKHVPSSIEGVILKYTSDLAQTILIWGYVIFFIMFLYYTLQILLKKR